MRKKTAALKAKERRAATRFEPLYQLFTTPPTFKELEARQVKAGHRSCYRMGYHVCCAERGYHEYKAGFCAWCGRHETGGYSGQFAPSLRVDLMTPDEINTTALHAAIEQARGAPVEESSDG